MPYYKFNEDDVFFNRIKAHPSCHFFSWKGGTYYNNQYSTSGAFNSPVGHAGDTGSRGSAPRYGTAVTTTGYGAYTSSYNSGYINLYEMNIDRYEQKHTLDTKHINEGGWLLIKAMDLTGEFANEMSSSLIFPFVTKDGSKNSLKSVAYDSYVEDFSMGDIISGSYPLTASLTRVFFEEGSSQPPKEIDPNPHENTKHGSKTTHYYQNKPQTTVKIKDLTDPSQEETITDAPKLQKKYIQMLENTINFYRKWSPHFTYSSSYDPLTGEDIAEGASYAYEDSAWDKSYQALSLLDIPSIFFGSSIKKGTVNLKYYITGTLVGELKDSKRNGELIQIGPSGSFKSGSVAGIVLYNEGALILTGAWDLTKGHATTFTGPEGLSRGEFGPALEQDYRHWSSGDSPSWIYFGTGINDGYPNHWDALQGAYTINGLTYKALDAASFHSSSFELAFSGTTYTPTITMMAHAKRGYLNWSNNPTYPNFSQSFSQSTSPTHYKENDIKTIKNTISSSFGCGFTGSFKKQTFINKVGIYDKNRNLIAIAKVATPVRKLETDEYTFKLKLDI